MFIYYGISPSWLTDRVRMTYHYRIAKVDKSSPECIMNGSCKVCGCTTPDLFFADKACEGGCYARIITRRDWKELVAKSKDEQDLKTKLFINYTRSTMRNLFILVKTPSSM